MKAYCITYPIKLLLFCKLLLFFQNKADSSDNEFMVISLFVYDNGLYCYVVRLHNQNWNRPSSLQIDSDKAAITRRDLSSRFFCIDATLLCEFESDKI